MNQKVEALLGFAVKSGKIVFGTDKILDFRKRQYLILCDESLSENAQKKLSAFALSRNIPLVSVESLSAALHKESVKAVALTDGNMAKEVAGQLS